MWTANNCGAAPYFGGVNTNGAWNVVNPPAIAGDRQPRICDSAQEASRSDPTVF